METNGLFIQKLSDLQKICDLQKFFDLRNYGSIVKNLDSSNPSIFRDQDQDHIVISAAMAYWRSDKKLVKSRAIKYPRSSIKILPSLRLR